MASPVITSACPGMFPDKYWVVNHNAWRNDAHVPVGVAPTLHPDHKAGRLSDVTWGEMTVSCFFRRWGAHLYVYVHTLTIKRAYPDVGVGIRDWVILSYLRRFFYIAGGEKFFFLILDFLARSKILKLYKFGCFFLFFEDIQRIFLKSHSFFQTRFRFLLEKIFCNCNFKIWVI